MSPLDNSIAIIGMSGVFPQAEDINQFRQNLRSGRDSVREISLERIVNSGLSYEKCYQVRAFLDRVDFFDHKFFNISKREAELMEPAQRILLELTCTAIENAGYSLKEFSGTNTAVYLGGDPYSDYPEYVTDYDATIYSGNLHAMQCGRISYVLNLTGPSVMIDTSCSSSLVAVHEACQKLIQKETDCAIAGGICIRTSFPEVLKGDADLGILSADGKSKTFDASADGTGSGEGGGIVILKRYADAVRDHDNILAIIKGSAINHGGSRSNGITAPSPVAQAELLLKAWNKAEITPEEISYIEVHGTGTKLGDPIEFKGITDAFKIFTDKKQFCALSALKTNIGHLNNAAGIAGLIKCVLSLSNSEIYPSLHFKTPNPFIDFANSAAYVANELLPWNGLTRLCGLNSFGISGTNAHIVLQNASRPTGEQSQLWHSAFLKISAKTESALRNYALSITEFIKNSTAPLNDILLTFNRGRDDHEFRIAIHVQDRHQLVEELTQHTNNLKKNLSVVTQEREITLLFSEERLPSKVNSKLYHFEPLFRSTVDDLSKIVKGKMSDGLMIVIEQIALYKILKQYGFRVRNIIATGIGRITKKIIKDEVSLEEGLVESVSATVGQQRPDFERFKNAVMQTADQNIFVEAGQGGLLLAQLKDWSHELENLKCLSLIDADSDNTGLINLSTLYLLGASIDSKDLRSESFNKIACPTYPFDRIRCWGGPKSLPVNAKVLDWCYNTTWGEEDEVISSPSGKNILVLTESSILANELKQKLAINNNVRCLFLTNTMEEVVLEIAAFDADIILFCQYSVENVSRIDLAVSTYATNLFELIKIHAVNPKISNSKFVLVTRGAFKITEADTKIFPCGSMMESMIRSALCDSPKANILAIDLSLESSVEGDVQSIIKTIGIESTIRFIGLRNGKRYVRSLSRVDADANMNPNWIKPNGNYLITGGASGLGLQISKFLVSAEKVNLIILGRTEIPSKEYWLELNEIKSAHTREKVTELRQLEKSGSTVEYFAVDIGDRNAVQSCFKMLQDSGITLDGIIHAAGVPNNDVSIEKKSIEDFKATLRPKVEGTINLCDKSKVLNLDFFVCFSSINAIVPQRRSIDYAAANAFLDGFAAANLGSSTRFVSINWPGWMETGMGHIEGHGDAERQLTNKEGVELFHYVMASKIKNVIISKENLTSFASNPFFYFKANNERNLIAHLRDQLTEKFINETNHATSETAEQKVIRIFKEVLKSDEISVDDDFFDCGGHSLNATQVMNRISKEFETVIELDDFFEHPTALKLGAFIGSRKTGISPSELSTGSINTARSYPLSHGQKRIWVESQLDASGLAYLMKMVYVINGEIQLSILEQAFKTLIERYEILRTNFTLVDGDVKQKILHPDEVRFQIQYKRGESYEKFLKESSYQEFFGPFDMTSSPLFRVKLFQSSSERCYLLFNMHHIISDGWSMDLLLKKLTMLYTSYADGTALDLKPLNFQYRDYATWQMKYLTDSENAQRFRTYWEQRLASPIPKIDLATDFPRPPFKTYSGDSVSLELSKEASSKLISLAKEHNASLFMVFLSSLTALLYLETNQNDIIIGAPVSGRSHHDWEDQLGLFINLLPLRIKFNPKITFAELLKNVRSVCLEAFRHQDYPFDKIIDDLKLPRDLSRSPLFDILLEVQELPDSEQVTLLNAAMIENDTPTVISKYDLSVAFVRDHGVIRGSIEYNSALFKAARIKHFKDMLCLLLNNLGSNKNSEIADIFSDQVEITDNAFEDLNTK